MEIKSGAFRKKKIYFSQVSNSALRDKELSLKAKGLYALIQSYITIEGFILYKNTLKSDCQEGNTAFESTWSELKKAGYLKQYKIKTEQGYFTYEYELLDEKEPVIAEKSDNDHTPKTEGVDNLPHGQVGAYNNMNPNKTDSNNTEKNKTAKQPNCFPDGVSDEIDVFVDETYPALFREHYSESHPPLIAYQRNRTKQILREFCEQYSVDMGELEDAAESFLRKEISDGNIKAFADSKMLYFMVVNTLDTDIATR